MITLNNINLSSIDLSGIDLRGIKLGLGGRGGGSGDGFPQLPGDVTRWHFGGLTNEMMAAMDDPRIEDADGKGRFLSFKNFLWAGMSGVGGYADNFSSESWKKPSDRSDITWTSSSFNITRVMNTGVQMYYQAAWEESESVIPEKRIIVKGLEDGQVLRYMNVGNRIIEISQDGIYTIPSFIFKGVSSYHGYSLAKKQESCDITIEQLPLYPGFILGDGVDDEAVTKNNLDLEDTYTVYTPLILLKYGGVVCGKSSAKDYSLNTVTSSKSIGFDSANSWSGSIPVDLYKFVLVVCKRNSKTMYVKDLITGKSNQSNSKEFVSNPGKYFIWRNTGGSWSQVAIAGQVICNGHFTTDEEDEKVLNWHKKQYPWLFPDQAWTVTGKTNEDTDRATIANITGNGNNLVLSNLGFIEGSGYNEEGEYAGYLVTDGVDDKIVSSAFTMGKDFTAVGEWAIIDEIDSRSGISKDFSLKILGKQNGLWLFINDPGNSIVIETKSLKAVCSDGRVYLNDWIEVVSSAKQRTPGSNNSMDIGFVYNDFAQMVFKNLAIYPTVLSKEDCIKAYNYLQTLKAK